MIDFVLNQVSARKLKLNNVFQSFRISDEWKGPIYELVMKIFHKGPGNERALSFLFENEIITREEFRGTHEAISLNIMKCVMRHSLLSLAYKVANVFQNCPRGESSVSGN